VLSGFTAGRWLIPRTQLRSMLRAKFGDPMLGVIGAYCLVWDLFGPDGNAKRDDKSAEDFSLLQDVVHYLRATLGGVPDVLVLESPIWAGIPRSISWPPMLAQGYQRAIELDAAGRIQIEPESQAERASASLVSRGPWTAWRYESSRRRSRSARNPYRETQEWPSSLNEVVAKASIDPRTWVMDFEQRPDSDPIQARVRSYVVDMAKITDEEDRGKFFESLDANEIGRNTNLPVSAVRRALVSLGRESEQ
jgi:hypothetical protein